jgi:ABC transporter substrate binding protein
LPPSADPARGAASLAKELVDLQPDVILAATNTPAVALRQYTLAIPIVFTQVSNPVAAGLVTNLARPEGNITGFTVFEFAMAGKWRSRSVRQAGWIINDKRVERIWRREGLKVPHKQPKRSRLWHQPRTQHEERKPRACRGFELRNV